MADFPALALSLIAKNGRAVSVRRDTGSTPVEVGKPWLGTVPSASDTPTSAVFLDTESIDELMRFSDGGRLERTQVGASGTVALVPASGIAFEITADMQLVDGSTVWEIKKAGLVQPAATPILYILELGK